MCLFYLLKQIYVYLDVHFYEPSSSFPPYSIPFDVNNEVQNRIVSKFIVLAWDQHNLIILLCKAWDQYTLGKISRVSAYFKTKAVVAVLYVV